MDGVASVAKLAMDANVVDKGTMGGKVDAKLANLIVEGLIGSYLEARET